MDTDWDVSCRIQIQKPQSKDFFDQWGKFDCKAHTHAWIAYHANSALREQEKRAEQKRAEQKRAEEQERKKQAEQKRAEEQERKKQAEQKPRDWVHIRIEKLFALADKKSNAPLPERRNALKAAAKLITKHNVDDRHIRERYFQLEACC
jgi:hypothetical protein